MKTSTFLLAFTIAVLAVVGIALVVFDKPGVSISFSETPDDLTLLAYYPNKDSKKVTHFIKSKLKMNNIADFDHLEIKHYHTPDQSMHLYIKSREGLLKIVLDKDENDPSSQRQLKETCEGLKRLLAQR